MENEIIKYLTKYITLSEETKEILIQSTIIKKYKKGTLLLTADKIANESFFVLQGCVRSYVLSDGEENTLEFYTEEQPLLPNTYGRNIPSGQYLECVEDCILAINTQEHEKKMFEKYPQFESICRIMSEVMMTNMQESFTNYRITNLEEKYMFLLEKRPDLFQRVPLYQLASYLGIKPESLSRLRKRLSKKKQ